MSRDIFDGNGFAPARRAFVQPAGRDGRADDKPTPDSGAPRSGRGAVAS